MTAKQLLDRHWQKLLAEMPDVYDFLVAIAKSDGTPFAWPGMSMRIGDKLVKDCG